MKKLMVVAAALFFNSVANASVMSIGNVNTYHDHYALKTTHGVSKGKLESFLKIKPGTLNYLADGKAKNGSAIRDSVKVYKGDEFSFDWKWYSNEKHGSYFNDYAFVRLKFNDVDVIADTYTPDYTKDTFTWTAKKTGWLRYGIGVVNVNDKYIKSVLRVKNIEVKHVAEPSALALLGLGIIGLGLARRRKIA